MRPSLPAAVVRSGLPAAVMRSTPLPSAYVRTEGMFQSDWLHFRYSYFPSKDFRRMGWRPGVLRSTELYAYGSTELRAPLPSACMQS